MGDTLELDSDFKDIKYRPFISANLLRIIAVIFLGISQIAAISLLYFKMIGGLTEEGTNKLTFLKSFVNISTPLLLVTILANITRNKEKLKKYCIIYFVLAIGFYLSEIFIFRVIIVPFLEETFLYMLNVEGEMPAEAHTFILKIVSYISSVFANLNTFLDIFLCSLFAFFALYEPNIKSKKGLILFRLGTLIPVLYFIVSNILTSLHNYGILNYGIEIGALVVHRNYACFAFFFIVVLYLKYREKRINEKDLRFLKYEKYATTNKGLLLFNLTIITLILILSLIDFLLSFIPNASYLNIGTAYNMYLCTPFLLFFNSQRKKHNKLTASIVITYMSIIFFIMFLFFILIADEAYKYIEMIAEIFRTINSS